jgi:hypothetical protein
MLYPLSAQHGIPVFTAPPPFEPDALQEVPLPAHAKALKQVGRGRILNVTIRPHAMHAQLVAEVLDGGDELLQMLHALVDGVDAEILHIERARGRLAHTGRVVDREADEIPAFLEAYPDIRGLSTMPPETNDPEESRPLFRTLRELAETYVRSGDPAAAEQFLRESHLGLEQRPRVLAVAAGRLGRTTRIQMERQGGQGSFSEFAQRNG